MVSELGITVRDQSYLYLANFLNTYTNYEIHFQKAEESKLDDISFENRPEIEGLATISTKNPAFSVSLSIGGGKLTNVPAS